MQTAISQKAESSSPAILHGGPLLPDVGVIALVADTWHNHWQPRHQILMRLARYFHVLWVCPATEWRRILKRPAVAELPPVRGFAVHEPEFWLPKLYRPVWLAELTSRLRLQRARRILLQRGCRKIILYLWRPEFADALLSVPFEVSCYHIDDEYSFSDVDLPLDEHEARLIASVDQVFIHSIGLLEKKGSINPHTTYVPNGADYQAYARCVVEPRDLALIPHPRIGYTGVLKRTLDWDLCLHLTRQHREWSFVFVGPVLSQPEVLGAVEELSKQPNVFFLGAKSAQDLPAYPQHFDVCIMPYRTNTHSMKYGYPLKLHEYLASGRPAVATPLVALREFSEVVSLATTPEEWSAALSHGLRPEAQTAERRAKRQGVARQHDWDLLVSRIAQTMVQHLGPEYSERLANGSGGERNCSERPGHSLNVC